jgi:pyruvate kinase
MQRRTKIVATLGPATNTPEAIEGLVVAGVDVVRLNFSHGSAEDHLARAELVRKIAAKHGRFVAVLADLQGPKIRIARFAEEKVNITKGQQFVLDATLERDAGDETRVGIDYKALITDSRPDDILLLDDGRIELRVLTVNPTSLVCEVLVGGPLSNNKGINRKGGGLAHRSKHRVDEEFHKIDESIAMSAMYAANHLHGVKAIICITESGDTPRLMSRIRSHLPIFAFSRNTRTQNRVSLFRGVNTVPFDSDAFPHEEVNTRAVQELLDRGVVSEGDHVLITKGDSPNAQGETNSLRVVRVPTNVSPQSSRPRSKQALSRCYAWVNPLLSETQVKPTPLSSSSCSRWWIAWVLPDCETA